MVYDQLYLFIIFTLDGILIGVLFDFFRILRKSFNTNDVVTYIEDICFWILTGILIIYFMYMFSDGELRLFMVLGLIMGIAFYILTFSRYVIKFSVKLLHIIFKPIFYILNKIKKIKNMLKNINTFKFRKKFDIND